MGEKDTQGRLSKKKIKICVVTRFITEPRKEGEFM